MRACITAGSMVLASFVVAGDPAEFPAPAQVVSFRSSGPGPAVIWTTRVDLAGIADPTINGASVHIEVGTASSTVWTLPAELWARPTPGVFRYENPDAPAGPSPIFRVTLKPTKGLRIIARQGEVPIGAPPRDRVQVSLRISDNVACSVCTAPSIDRATRYLARRCDAPRACVATTTSTVATSSSSSTATSSSVTSTSSTSTTFVPGICGNLVVDAPGEECDGEGLGYIEPLEITFGCQPPGSPNECTGFCGLDHCVLTFTQFAGPPIPCCEPSQCQDTRGAGAVRRGACIPPTCTTDADCHGYRCVGGTCCGDPRQVCGIVGCCPDTNAACTPGGGSSVCCLPTGAECTDAIACCSGSCSNRFCD